MDMNLVTGLQHIGIPTEHFEDTLVFFQDIGFLPAYTTILGHEKNRVCFLQLGNFMVEVYEGDCPGQRGAIEHFALNVTNIAVAYTDMVGKGYHALEGEIRDLPFFKSGVRFFTIEGPNKEKVEFCQRL